jgi:predicted signal transduction protein with EAL and GGDEF domain
MYKRVQAAAPEGSSCARLGGDEFGIILPHHEPAAIAAACDKILDACCSPMPVFDHTVTSGASLGVAQSVPDELDCVDIIRRADIALYAAKRNGRAQFRLFDKGLDESSRFRQQIEAGLREALKSDQLSLHFQPIVGQETLETVGFEALVRWHSPQHGEISPALFVPIAEESTLIHELSDWVMPRALQACKQWPREYVSVNFSPRQFRRPSIVGYVTEQAAAAGVPPERVQIEITETALFDDPVLAEQILNGLRLRGFRVALDDFGTGYSSLFNLKSFSIDCIKIDKSFVSALGQEKNATAIVSSIAQLARSLGMSVVAEGVEDQFQENALRLSGCSHMQGYRFGHPAVPARLSQPSAVEEGKTAPCAESNLLRAQA